MELTGKKIAVLCEDLVDDKEMVYPYYRMQEAGAEVHVIGPAAGTHYKGKYGIDFKSDKAASEISADDYAAVIIPGGYAPDKMRRDPAFVAFVREMDRQGKVVAAICHAGWMLVTADVLRGRTATAFHSLEVDLRNAGAEFVDREVVRDGNLITSRGPDDLPAFCRAIIEVITNS